jgi:multidrug resistance protein, MATE family
VPIGMTGLAEGGLFQASALMMGWIGTVELAAHGIALEVAALTFMMHVGVSSAATIRVARFQGQADHLALRQAAKVSVVMSLGVALGSVLLFLTAARPIVALFLDLAKPDSAAILAYGTMLLGVAAVFQLADGLQVMALGLLRGVQDTRVPMWLAAVSYWLIGIPCSYVLAFHFGYGGVGLWIGLVVGLVCAAASLMWRFWRLVR